MTKVLALLALCSCYAYAFLQDPAAPAHPTAEQIQAETKAKEEFETALSATRIAELKYQQMEVKGELPKRPEQVATDWLEVSIQSPAWEEREIKVCISRPDLPLFIACDPDDLKWKESFINVLGSYALTGPDSESNYRRAWDFALASSKRFEVKFSSYAWARRPEDADVTFIAWKCTKVGRITCQFAGRHRVPAIDPAK